MAATQGSHWFSVRCVFLMRQGPSWTPRTDGLAEYEERITLWRGDSLEEAIELAEREAREYASDLEVAYLGLAQAYAIGSDLDLPFQPAPGHGDEVFSLIRVDARGPNDYLSRYFDTGEEFQQNVRYERSRDEPSNE
jgi:hypothetical protein